ncbi:hypothetical protein ACRARG_15170 [Pseudooceanicola sp. C21-150M6]
MAQGQAVSPGELRELAVKALDAGYPATALDMTSALLRRDPQDVQTLLIRSRAARDTGDHPLARATARQAWDLSATDDRVRYSAALAMAQALSSEGKRTRAQIWLRRAAQIAPDAQTKSRAVRDFRYVRSRNRWTTELNFNLAPKSNINNGSSRSTVTLLVFDQPIEVPLPGATRALSGLEYSGGLSTRFRLAETTRRATDLTFSARYTTYTLSGSAQAAAPGTQGSDFALGTVYGGLSHKWLTQSGRAEYTIAGAFGRSWYGGQAYGNHSNLSAGVNMAFGKRDRLGVTFSADLTRGPAAPHADAFAVSLRHTHRTRSGAMLGVWTSATRSQSDIPTADFTDFAAGIDFAPRILVMGAQPRFGIGLRSRDYPFSAYAPGYRTDFEQNAWIDLTFKKIDYYGFHPTVRMQLARPDSNINLFDVDRSGISFGITSAY